MEISASQNLPSNQTQDLRCDLDRGKTPINAGVITGMGVNGRVFGSARTLLYGSTLSISGLDFARSFEQFLCRWLVSRLA